MLSRSRMFARDGFNLNRGLEPGSVEAEKGVEHALGVAQILRENVVQGQANEKDPQAFSKSLSFEQTHL